MLALERAFANNLVSFLSRKDRRVGKTLLDMAVSLDGFIAEPDDADIGLHQWFFAPDARSQAIVDESIRACGAIIMGRRTFDLGDSYDGFADTPYRVPHIVLTQAPPTRLPKGDTPFLFTHNAEGALARAQAAAGERSVVIGGGAQTAQYYLRAGLVDEIQLHVASVLAGAGAPLFKAESGKIPMRLVEARPFSTGAVLLRLRPEKPAPAPETDVALPSGIGKPATRALVAAGYTRLEQIASLNEAELLALHGVGPKAVRLLRDALTQAGLALRDDGA